MKTVGVTGYTNQTPSSHFTEKNCLSSRPSKMKKKNHEMWSTAKTYEHNRFDETSVVDRHRHHMAAMFDVLLDKDHSKLPMLLRYAGYLNFTNGSIVAFNC